MLFQTTGITWDREVDGVQDTTTELPKDVEIEVNVDGLDVGSPDDADGVEEAMLDALSDEYGFCVLNVERFHPVDEGSDMPDPLAEFDRLIGLSPRDDTYVRNEPDGTYGNDD